MAKRESILGNLEPADEETSEAPARKPRRKQTPSISKEELENKVFVSILYGEMTVPDVITTTKEEAEKIVDTYKSLGANDEDAFLISVGQPEEERFTIRIDASIRMIRITPLAALRKEM